MFFSIQWIDITTKSDRHRLNKVANFKTMYSQNTKRNNGKLRCNWNILKFHSLGIIYYLLKIKKYKQIEYSDLSKIDYVLCWVNKFVKRTKKKNPSSKISFDCDAGCFNFFYFKVMLPIEKESIILFQGKTWYKIDAYYILYGRGLNARGSHAEAAQKCMN